MGYSRLFGFLGNFCVQHPFSLCCRIYQIAGISIFIFCSDFFHFLSADFPPKSCWLLVWYPPCFTNFLAGFDFGVLEIFSWISQARLFPSFPLGCFQRLNNSPNCPNSLVAHQIHFVLPWASESTNGSAGRHWEPMRAREATEPTNESSGCHLPTQTAGISLKLV